MNSSTSKVTLHTSDEDELGHTSQVKVKIRIHSTIVHSLQQIVEIFSSKSNGKNLFESGQKSCLSWVLKSKNYL